MPPGSAATCLELHLMSPVTWKLQMLQRGNTQRATADSFASVSKVWLQASEYHLWLLLAGSLSYDDLGLSQALPWLHVPLGAAPLGGVHLWDHTLSSRTCSMSARASHLTWSTATGQQGSKPAEAAQSMPRCQMHVMHGSLRPKLNEQVRHTSTGQWLS